MNTHKILIFFFFISFQTAFCQVVLFQASPTKFIYGDSIKFMHPSYNDSDWNVLFDSYLECEEKNISLRTEIYINADLLSNEDYSLLLDIVGNYEAYWNGKKIGQNFEGNLNSFTGVGDFDKSFLLDDNYPILSKNNLGLRVKVLEDKILELDAILIQTKESEYKTNFYAYGFLFAQLIIYLFILYFLLSRISLKNKYFNFLVAVISLLSIITIVIEFSVYMNFLKFNAFALNQSIIDLVTYLLLFSLTFFLCIIFNPNFKNILLSFAFLSLCISYLAKLDYYYLQLVGLLPGLIILISNIKSKSVVHISSFIFFILIITVLFYWQYVSITEIGFLILLFYLSIGYLMEQEKKEKMLVESKLRAVRLEAEMLKKLIQPHYIMNSLNSAVSLIENSPKLALNFLNELSEEFRLFIKFSDKKFVPLIEEIELCERHINIMQFRQLRNFTLKTKLENPNKLIPSAILHTLIENGITHNKNSVDKICFSIVERDLENNTEIIVKVVYDNNCEIINFHEDLSIYNEQKIIDIVEGTGLKYIKSRLNECCDNKWQLNFYSGEYVWITKLILANKD